MRPLTRLSILLGAAAVSACAATPGRDYGIDAKSLTELRAAVWTDPTGCQHWFISDGAEGYLTPRMRPDGSHVCPNGRNAGLDGVPRATVLATIWKDQNGCEHWVYDGGPDGYMSARLQRDGRPSCPGVSAATPERTITLSADALFDTASAQLRPGAAAELDEFGRKMRELGKNRVRVIGHTDSRGTDAYNQDLSERRASSVAGYLSSNFGIEAETEGQGERAPVAGNDTASGRQANRRVEIAVLD